DDDVAITTHNKWNRTLLRRAKCLPPFRPNEALDLLVKQIERARFSHGRVLQLERRELVRLFGLDSLVRISSMICGDIQSPDQALPGRAGILLEHCQQIDESCDRSSRSPEIGVADPLRAMLHEARDTVVGQEVLLLHSGRIYVPNLLEQDEEIL